MQRQRATIKDVKREVEAYQDGVIWHLVVDEDFRDHDAVLSRWEVIGGQYEFREGGQIFANGQQVQ